VGDKLLYEGDA